MIQYWFQLILFFRIDSILIPIYFIFAIDSILIRLSNSYCLVWHSSIIKQFGNNNWFIKYIYYYFLFRSRYFASRQNFGYLKLVLKYKYIFQSVLISNYNSYLVSKKFPVTHLKRCMYCLFLLGLRNTVLYFYLLLQKLFI